MGEMGCTTGYGVSEGTGCLSYEGSPACAELCSDPVAPCGADRQCVPRPFEPGGLCAFRHHYVP